MANKAWNATDFVDKDVITAAEMIKHSQMHGDLGTGRSATYSIAASDSPAHVKAQADYVCDGVDDQVEINAAIAAPAVGGKVLLMPGIFKTSAPIVMNKSVWLAGSHISVESPIGTSILLQPSSNCDIVQVDGNGTHLYFPHISDMFLDGDKATQTSGHGIHFIADCSDTIVENVFVHRCKEDGIHETAGWYMKYINVWSEFNIGAGWNVNDAYLTSCISSENDGNGIILDGSRKLHLTNSRIKRNKLHGIYVTGWTSYEIAITGNSIVYNSDTNAGIYDGIHITGGHATYFRSMEINGNTIGDVDGTTQRNAIRLTDGNGIGIHNNILYPETANPTIVNTAIGTSNQIRNNIGFVTENSGTATLLSAGTSIVVTHGLDVTPVAGDIIVVPMETWGNMAKFWIDTYTATQFTIHADIAPGADTDFAWKAIVL